MSKVKENNNGSAMPMLLPYEPENFWARVRNIVREELQSVSKNRGEEVVMSVPGMTVKPLYKMAEVCVLFGISKPTIYEWIKAGKLKPFKVQSRVYFLWQDIQSLMHTG